MIDLRSDTVTAPNAAMRAVMAKAEVGDDVYGEDPTVNRLEATVAEMAGHEGALFVPSGTQSNLIALLTHCQRGDEYIVGQNAHTYRYEGGGAAVLGSIQPQPIEFEADGSLDLNKVAAKVKPDDFHFARTRLLALENTVGGLALPFDYIQKAGQFALQHGLQFHLDGARVMNAAVALQLSLEDIASQFDSVSICLSKGLGAPVGSVLVGSKSYIEEARRWRKMLGGGMRQAGILAAAALYALENNVSQLAEDHENARFLAQALQSLEPIQVHSHPAQTNMVFVTLNLPDQEELIAFMGEKGIRLSGGSPMRMVLHRDINREDLHKVVECFKDYLKLSSLNVQA